jgi:hypothetical protein
MICSVGGGADKTPRNKKMLSEQNGAVKGQLTDGALIEAPRMMTESEFIAAFSTLSLEERREFIRCNCATH